MKTTISKDALMIALGIAAVVGFAYVAMPASAQTREAAEIDSVTEQYRQAWQRGDVDGVLQFWTADAKAIGPGSVAAGTAAIRASLEFSMKLGIHDLRNEEREVYGSGDTVVEVTRSLLFDSSGTPMFTMRYMTLWQKSGGQWRIHREIAIPENGDTASVVRSAAPQR